MNNKCKTLCKNIIASITLAAFITQPLAPVLASPATTKAPNGVPVVDINAPNSKGLSYNPFDKFNVGPKGLILNNSQRITNTQLAGYIMGNKNLQNEAARLILAEVLGKTPSRLNGTLEIAGQKAGFILANPNGIAVNGAGFINVSNMTLTTGKPILDPDGNLSYNINQGTINIEGKGLDASNTDKAAILARAVKINAGIWAKGLAVTTGKNQINADNLAITQTNQQEKQDNLQEEQQFAVDIAALGGMYAGKIKLIGTEKGLGVNNEGQIQANQNFTLTTQGKLIQAGTILAGGQITIKAQQANNQGTIYAQQNAKIETQALTNANLLAAGKDAQIKAGALHNSGTLAAGLSQDGRLTGQGNLQIEAQKINQAKNLLAGNQIQIKAKQLTNQGQIHAGRQISLAIEQIQNTKQASLLAGDAIQIQAQKEITSQGAISAGNLAIKANKTNLNGQTSAQGNLKIQSGQINLQAGNLQAGNKISLTASKIENQAGKLSAQKLQIKAGSLDNTQGQILQYGEGNLELSLAGKLTNTKGNIATNSQNLSITAEGIQNNQGTIYTKGNLGIKTGTVTNNQGSLLSGQDQTLQIKTTLDNQQGTIAAEKETKINTGQIKNTGEIQAGQKIAIHVTKDYAQEKGSSLNANGSLELESDGKITNQGKITAYKDIKITAKKIENEAAIEANQNIKLNGQEVTNQGEINAGAIEITSKNTQNTGAIIGGSLQINANNLTNSGEKAILASTGKANLYIKNNLTNQNQAAIYTLGNIIIAADETNNKTNELQNQSASIEAEENIKIQAKNITNKRAQFQTKEEEISKQEKWETIPVKNNPNDDPYIQSAIREYTETIYQTKIIKDTGAGKITAGGNLEIEAGQLTNEISEITAGKQIKATVGNLQNTSIEFKRTTVKQGKDHYTIKEKDHYEGENGGNGAGGNAGGSGNGRSRLMRAGIVPGKTTHKYIDYNETQTEAIPGETAVIQGSQAVEIKGQNLQNTVIGKQPGSPLPKEETNKANNNIQNAKNQNQQDQEQIKNQLQQDNLGINLKLPQSALYQINQQSQAKYLVETNPRFTNYKNFISSDYLLNQIGYDSEKVMKRLGDGFYEQQLIKQQLQIKYGSSLIEGYENAEQQYKALLENGSEAMKDLELTLGITLTKEEINALKQDIVWLEEKQIEGQKVLVPVIYLAKINQGKRKQNGSIITGSNVNIETTRSLTNQGKISGQEELNITVGREILNQNGKIQGGQVRLQAKEDIKNEQGKIQANENLNITTKKSYISQAAEASGKNIQIEAGKNIQIKAKQTKKQDAFQEKTSTKQSELKAQENLILKAGQNIQIQAGDIKAGQNIALQAQKDIELKTTKQTNHQTGIGTLIGKKDQIEEVINQSTEIKAGKNITLIAKENLTAEIPKKKKPRKTDGTKKNRRASNKPQTKPQT